MATQLIRGIGVAVAMTVATWGWGAIAQEAPRTRSSNIPDAMDELFFANSGTYYFNRTAWRQANFIFGFGGFDSAAFPEREIEWDAQAIGLARDHLLRQQNNSSPLIRVPDLVNPYSQSLQLLPTTQAGQRVTGSEFSFDRAPFP